ncbi:methyltransferase family protein [Pelagibacterium xiamenense]|uniref:methyltransferase family protein n=1 Tax=Pelagibacterium xiamenense TaxID=2901140 RepID=UPI001E405746|nr:isoprenylcysteine carboxylmethyltransferase family protein [Pelagibacterium xiamenense]MCD7059523.1 isoprenylcysteine carboxylmethyltransferase family protein [Pelagibacterium xiamenense]
MAEAERDNPGLIMPPPLFPLIALAIAVVLDWLVAVPIFPPPGVGELFFWIGIVLILAGVAVAAQAVTNFRAAGTNVEPYKPSTQLVTTGIYRYTRNPIYLGFLAVYTGLCLAFALEWGVLLLPFLWLALDRLVVAREEDYLSGKFGEAYARYLTHTRRWF